MALNMQFLPESQLVFPYQQNKHLVSNLKITNKNDFPIVYKFKASTLNRFVIRPNSGILKPGQNIDVQIVLHKDGVATHQSQKIQVVYGKTYQEAQNKFYTLHVQNYLQNQNLNLTMMVQKTSIRVKNLEQQIKKYQGMPKTTISGSGSSTSKKSSKKIIQFILIIIIGFICGFFSPVRMYRKGGLLSFIYQADTHVLQHEQV